MLLVLPWSSWWSSWSVSLLHCSLPPLVFLVLFPSPSLSLILLNFLLILVVLCSSPSSRSSSPFSSPVFTSLVPLPTPIRPQALANELESRLQNKKSRAAPPHSCNRWRGMAVLRPCSGSQARQSTNTGSQSEERGILTHNKLPVWGGEPAAL